MAIEEPFDPIKLMQTWIKISEQQQERAKRFDDNKRLTGDGGYTLSDYEVSRRQAEVANKERFWVFFTKEDFANAKDERGSNDCPFVPFEASYCYKINLDYPCIHEAYKQCCDFYGVALLTGDERRDFEKIVLDEIARVGVDFREFRNSTTPRLPTMEEKEESLAAKEHVPAPWEKLEMSEWDYHKRFSYEY